MRFFNLLLIFAISLQSPKLAFGVMAASKGSSSTFYDTTGGADAREDFDSVGGLSDAEIAAMELDKEEKSIYKKLRDGRYPSSKDPRTRYSTLLEIHDANLDGITDHDGAANGLEGPMDQIAIGNGGTGGSAREKALREATNKVGGGSNCGKDKDGNNICQNISPILIDVGNAHGGPTEAHRVYELVAPAIAVAKKAGVDYAARVIQDATNDKRLAGMGSGEIRPDIDLLRSEVAYLETVKTSIIRNGWRAMRADRLGEQEVTKGNNLGKELNTELSSIAADGNAKDESANNKLLANRIAVRHAVSSTKICHTDQDNISQVAVCSEKELDDFGGCKEAVPPAPANQKKACMDLRDYANAQDQEKVKKSESLYREAESKLSPEAKKSIAENEGKILKCMDANTWCYDPIHARDSLQAQLDKAKTSSEREKINAEIDKRTYAKVQGDIGNAYDYTQEAIYNKLDQANKAPLSQFESIMSTIDFDSRTDAKTKSKPYAAMMKEVTDARQYAREVRKQAQEIDQRQRDLGYNVPDGNFTKDSMFNPETMSVQQLFGRNPARDAKSIIDHSKDWEKLLGENSSNTDNSPPPSDSLNTSSSPNVPQTNSPLKLQPNI